MESGDEGTSSDVIQTIDVLRNYTMRRLRCKREALVQELAAEYTDTYRGDLLEMMAGVEKELLHDYRHTLLLSKIHGEIVCLRQQSDARREFSTILYTYIFKESQNITWGLIMRVVTMMVGLCELAEDSTDAKAVINWTNAFVNDYFIDAWIKASGGWEGFPSRVKIAPKIPFPDDANVSGPQMAEMKTITPSEHRPPFQPSADYLVGDDALIGMRSHDTQDGPSLGVGYIESTVTEAEPVPATARDSNLAVPINRRRTVTRPPSQQNMPAAVRGSSKAMCSSNQDTMESYAAGAWADIHELECTELSEASVYSSKSSLQEGLSKTVEQKEVGTGRSISPCQRAKCTPCSPEFGQWFEGKFEPVAKGMYPAKTLSKQEQRALIAQQQ